MTTIFVCALCRGTYSTLWCESTEPEDRVTVVCDGCFAVILEEEVGT